MKQLYLQMFRMSWSETIERAHSLTEGESLFGSKLQAGFIQEAAHQIREHSRVFEDYFREHFENIYMIKFRR